MFFSCYLLLQQPQPRIFKGREIEKRLLVGIRNMESSGTNYHRADKLNENWFLTKAKAEKKLKLLKEDKNNV